MSLALTVLVAALTFEAPAPSSRPDCVWSALPSDQRAVLLALPPREAIAYRFEDARRALRPGEAGKAMVACGAEGGADANDFLGIMVVSALAEREAAEAELALRFTRADLAKAFDLVAPRLNQFFQTPDDEAANDPSIDPTILRARFLGAARGPESSPHDPALVRYFEARSEEMLTAGVWRRQEQRAADRRAEAERRRTDRTYVQRDVRPAWESENGLRCAWRKLFEDDGALYEDEDAHQAEKLVAIFPSIMVEGALSDCGGDPGQADKIGPYSAVLHAERRLIRRFTAAQLDAAYRSLPADDRAALRRTDPTAPEGAAGALARFQAQLGRVRPPAPDMEGEQLDSYALYRARLDD